MTPPEWNETERRRLETRARETREGILKVVYESGSGHVGGALSEVEVLVALYDRLLRISPETATAPDRDRFVLSKGHGGLGLAVVLADRGFLPREELATFGKTGSRLGMHMDHGKVPGIEASTGSLGHGLGIAVGMALGTRTQKLPSRTLCLASDGECYEGSTWEAAAFAGGLHLDNLVLVIDRNGLTMDGDTEREMPLEPLDEKWRAFGWRVLACDGHDLEALVPALETALAPSGKPTVVIARTVKGKGVDFMEGASKWHYGALDSEAYARALASVTRARATT